MYNKFLIIVFSMLFLISCNEESIETDNVNEQQNEVVGGMTDVVEDEADDQDSSDDMGDGDQDDSDDINIGITKTGTLVTTSDYICQGDFTVQENGTGVIVTVASNFRADQVLPGYGMFLTNNPRSVQNALQIDGIGPEFAGHFSGSASFVLENVGIDDYQYLVHWCVPFNIEVGVGEIQ